MAQAKKSTRTASKKTTTTKKPATKKVVKKRNLSEAVVDEYKGKPVIKLPTTDEPTEHWHYFTFGLAKAKIILANLQSIKNFVADFDTKD